MNAMPSNSMGRLAVHAMAIVAIRPAPDCSSQPAIQSYMIMENMISSDPAKHTGAKKRFNCNMPDPSMD